MNELIKEMRGKRFILNEDQNPVLFGQLCKFIGNKTFQEAGDKGVIVIWPTWRTRSDRIIFFPCGCRKGSEGITFSVNEGINILKDLTATTDKGREIVKGLNDKIERELVPDLEIGTNIFDIV